ncbi:hypothetical protein GCM10023238_08680 [Streptomyces heliomycini]
MDLDAVGNQPLWAYAVLTDDAHGELTGDIAVHADDGHPLGRVTGFRAADIERASAAVSLGTIDSWLADIVWTETPYAPTPLTRPRPSGETGSSSPTDRGVADELATRIAARGGRCHLVRPGPAYRMAPERHESTTVPGLHRRPGAASHRAARGRFGPVRPRRPPVESGSSADGRDPHGGRCP